MSATPQQSSSAAAIAPSEPASTPAPLCFVIDGDGSIRHFLSLILHGAGIDTEEFADGQGLRQALSRRAPDLVFLDIPLESAEAIACVVALGDAQLSRTRAAHVEPRLGRARPCQKHRRTAAAANAAGAAQAVRDQRHRQAACRTSSSAIRRRLPAASILTKPWRTNGSNSGISRRSICAESNWSAPKRYARARHPQHGVLIAERVHARRQGGEPDRAVRTGFGKSADRSRQLRQARRQSAHGGQHPGHRAGEARRRRHRADLSAAIREMAGPDHRRHRRADRDRSGARQRHHQTPAAPQRPARDRRFRPRLFLAGAAQGTAVCRTQARPRLRDRLRHRQGQCPVVQDGHRPRAQFRQRRRGDRHREGVRRAGSGQHGLRLRPGLPARPADAGGALHLAVAPACRLAGVASGTATARAMEKQPA